ncbi:hypothetical protein NUW54_g11588 [Trametes sanguinea]|uniref:Uncharacterized protein n=1 Tax=Trametes sanguinea TaxID=158606 RepID=A0ACC1NBK4_9APHY|nr:hypothetical protein NUW54_g11588 [Trametes sanguinea]
MPGYNPPPHEPLSSPSSPPPLRRGLPPPFASARILTEALTCFSLTLSCVQNGLPTLPASDRNIDVQTAHRRASAWSVLRWPPLRLRHPYWRPDLPGGKRTAAPGALSAQHRRHQLFARGTYLSTWERPVKLEDGSQHKNLRVFSVSTGEELVAFSQKSQEGWELQFTISESHAVRLVGQEIQVFRPVEWSKGVVDKLKVEGATTVTLSPGLNPSVAVFIAEKKGQPASVKIYSLTALGAPPTCQKTFFKAQRSQIKWNTLGTQVLILTQTDVDQANKSYYGETGGLYLLSAAGNFDCRVTLDKEGPVHDFAWSPNSKEFCVVYGCEFARSSFKQSRH